MTRYFPSARKALLTLGLAGLALFQVPAVHADDTATKATINQAAPDFTLPAASGRQVSLADYKGKIVVLEWLNHSCPFVKKHYSVGNMQKLQADAAARGVVWLTINSSASGKQGHETAEQTVKTATEKGAKSAEILLDEQGTVGRMYGAKTTPHMYVIDSTGVLRYAGAIDDNASTDSDDIAGSKNYVSAALEALAAGKTVEPQLTEAYGCSVKYAS